MRITPIIAPMLNWRDFVSEVHRALGRSPTASLNMAGLEPGLLKTVPVALGEFQRKNTAAIPFLKSRNSDQVLSHLFCSFLVEGDQQSLARLLSLARLNILMPEDSNEVAILTGSLREWREAVLSLSRLTVTVDVRQAANEIQRYLTLAGLDLFSGCTAKRHSDGTTILEIK